MPALLYDPFHHTRRLTRRYSRLYSAVEWTATILLVLATVTDVASTWVTLSTGPYVETVPISRWALQTAGWGGLIVKDALVTGLLLIVWRYTPIPYRLAIPATAAAVRVYATVGNILLVL